MKMPRKAERTIDSDTIKRLRVAIDFSRKKLENFRKNRRELIREYVGHWYGDGCAPDKIPFNLIELAVNTYQQNLVSGVPQWIVNSPYNELGPSSSRLELAGNHLFGEIKLKETLEYVVLDAFFAWGILKCGKNYSGTIELGGFRHDIGQPYSDHVSIDNWVHDTEAEKWEHIQFCGDKFRLRLDDAKEAGIYFEDAIKKLKSSEISYKDEGGNNTTASLSGEDRNPEPFVDEVELWDIWLPHEGKVITFPVDPPREGQEDLTLYEGDWNGAEDGPYHTLSFNPVPDNIMPIPPASLWFDIHSISNRLYRKIARQAERQKTVLGYQGGEEDDANRIKQAGDGDIIRMDNPEKTKEFRFGGYDPNSLAFLIQNRDLFSYLAGNLDSLGGLGVQADTVGQEAILDRNSSKRIQSMQQKVYEFTKSVMVTLGDYMWSDPLIDIPIVKPVPGFEGEMYVRDRFNSDSKEGDFLDYNFEIVPFSLQAQSPEQKIRFIMEIFSTLILPALPMLQEQGITPNFQGLMNMFARYRHLPELNQLLNTSGILGGMEDGPVSQSSGGGAQPPRQSPVTHRTNERVNRPGMTRSGQDQVMMQSLLNNGMQDSVSSSMGRPQS